MSVYCIQTLIQIFYDIGLKKKFKQIQKPFFDVILALLDQGPDSDPGSKKNHPTQMNQRIIQCCGFETGRTWNFLAKSDPEKLYLVIRYPDVTVLTIIL